MINVLALALVVSSLTASGMWSPLSDRSPGADRTVVREAHRVVVVEYERQVPSETLPPPPHDLLDEEATNSQSLSPEATTSTTTGGDVAAPTPHSAKELICDAYGSCKEKLSDILAKSKGHVSDKASHMKEAAQHLAEEAKEETKNAIKDTVEGGKDVAGNLSSAAEKTVERAGEIVHRNLSDVLRRAKDVASDAAGLVHAEEAARCAGLVAHLLGFSVAYGAGFWVTFVSSHVLATTLPRQQFGTVQSKVYPVYFRTMAYGVGLAAAAQWLGQGMEERAQGFNLVALLALVLANMVYLEPKATKVMFEKMKMEKEEGRGRDMADVVAEPATTAPMATTTTTNPGSTTYETPTTYGVRTAATAAAVEQEAVKGRTAKLKKRLKKLNTYSSVVNILSLMGLTWHLVHLAGRMQVTC